MTVGEVTLAVRTRQAEQERRPPVVLLPATGETAEDWDVVAAVLARSRDVHAVNLRGHGSSDWPGRYALPLFVDDVVGLLPRLADRPVDLVGHSLGGLVACGVAAARPPLVRRLVLEDVGLLRPRPPGLPGRPPGELPFDWAMVEQVRPQIDDPDPGWAATVAAIQAPTLVIAGGPTSPVPDEDVAALVRTVGHGELVTLDTGHLVHDTAPEEFLTALLAFLDRDPPAGER